MTADSWIEEGKPNDNHGDDKHLELIAKPNPATDTRIVMVPDLPTPPTGCTLVSAVLVLDEHGYQPSTLRVRRLTGPWTEMGVTWSNVPGTAGPGVTAPTAPDKWSIDLETVISAIYSSGNNYGFEISDTAEQGGGNATNRFHSREYDPAELRPTITYTWG